MSRPGSNGRFLPSPPFLQGANAPPTSTTLGPYEKKAARSIPNGRVFKTPEGPPGTF